MLIIVRFLDTILLKKIKESSTKAWICPCRRSSETYPLSERWNVTVCGRREMVRRPRQRFDDLHVKSVVVKSWMLRQNWGRRNRSKILPLALYPRHAQCVLRFGYWFITLWTLSIPSLWRIHHFIFNAGRLFDVKQLRMTRIYLGSFISSISSRITEFLL